MAMIKNVFVLLGVVGLSGTLVVAQQKPRIESRSIQQVSPANAQEMFRSYCAPCHGLTGKGDGPAASALKKAPADLTKISARNGGKFPTVQVNHYIMGVEEVAAHGNRDMPIWGNLFRSLNPGDRAVAELRGSNLTDYLKKMQQ